jgi:hypothetical protein
MRQIVIKITTFIQRLAHVKVNDGIYLPLNLPLPSKYNVFLAHYIKM